MKPDCYDCKHRRDLPGDEHSACAHPDRMALHIVGDPHGVRMGWFMWPFNFDPRWLRECGGFTAIEGQKKPPAKETLV